MAYNYKQKLKLQHMKIFGNQRWGIGQKLSRPDSRLL